MHIRNTQLLKGDVEYQGVYIDSVLHLNSLCRSSPEGAPGMETASKAMRFIAFAHQAQLSRVLCILGPHVLNINLTNENYGN